MMTDRVEVVFEVGGRRVGLRGELEGVEGALDHHDLLQLHRGAAALLGKESHVQMKKEKLQSRSNGSISSTAGLKQSVKEERFNSTYPRVRRWLTWEGLTRSTWECILPGVSQLGLIPGVGLTLASPSRRHYRKIL